MIKIFIEYKVIPEKERQYLELLEQTKTYYREQGFPDYRAYKGIEQPDIYVEEFTVQNTEEYHKQKKERLDTSQPRWEALHDCIAGNASKVHFWGFEEK